MRDYNLGKRSIVIAGVAILIVVVYILRLFQLQINVLSSKVLIEAKEGGHERSQGPSGYSGLL